MNYSFFIFINLLIISFQNEIIRDLPYNIYHIEDMNRYETKTIPEGTKYFIRFPPSSNENIIFYLTIPKNISLFPIYFTEFSEYPNIKDINNIDFKNEIELKNFDDLYYRIYSFNIKSNKLYKLLYFKNNEALNYLSFYASQDNYSNDLIPIKDLILGKEERFNNIISGTKFIFRVFVDIVKDLKLKINIDSIEEMPFNVNITDFQDYPNDVEIYNKTENWAIKFSESINKYSNYISYQYTFMIDDDSRYITILLEANYDIISYEISVIDNSGLPTWAIIVIVVGTFVFILGITLMYTFCKCCRECANSDACKIILACLECLSAFGEIFK